MKLLEEDIPPAFATVFLTNLHLECLHYQPHPQSPSSYSPKFRHAVRSQKLMQRWVPSQFELGQTMETGHGQIGELV